MASSSRDVLPTGGRIFTSIPDIFFLPEFVFGGLVWCLVASTSVLQPNPMGWVMFVSIFCFVMTTLWFFIFLCGANQSDSWPAVDAFYHFVAVLFYLSSSVVMAYFILTVISQLDRADAVNYKVYRLDIAAVVMSYLTTLLYFLHAIFSAIRWKRS